MQNKNLKSTELYKNLGFSKNEIKIWEFLEKNLEPENSLLTVSVIQTNINIPRSTIVDILKKLMKRSLVIVKIQNGKKTYRQNSYLQILKESEINFGEISKVMVHVGIENILKTWEIIDRSQEHRWYLYQSLQNISYFLEKKNSNNLNYIINKNNKVRENKQITELFIDVTPEQYLQKVKETMDEKDFAVWVKSVKRNFISYQVPTAIFHSQFDIFTFQDSLFLTNWKKEICIEIKQLEIVNIIKQFFNILKKDSYKFDFNSYIEKYV